MDHEYYACTNCSAENTDADIVEYRDGIVVLECRMCYAEFEASDAEDEDG